ncbi:hypothetical protein ACIBFB_03525 [Nocardiopsis sp. NPDC050513]|uniref:hypothetical protein n=1 Tax=Nocardiopsis sp. NPDC050513 TaxID=3364338 RepID=UPI00378AF97C
MRTLSRTMAVAGLAGALTWAGGGLALADVRPGVSVDPGSVEILLELAFVVSVQTSAADGGPTSLGPTVGPLELGVLLPAVQHAPSVPNPPPPGD